ncbi:hypothetical protein IW262DRAFT_1363571 [Armillaria fumosa]|nr:hypothetical protein IW262DRAFT_1363571 [Armillaria fumosa]
MPVRAAVIAHDYSVVSSGWLKNTGMRSGQCRDLLVSCMGLQGTGSFLLSCLVFDLEGYDALLGSDVVAYYWELCCTSFSAQNICAQPVFKYQSLPLEVCGGTTCGQQHLYVDYLVEHSITGIFPMNALLPFWHFLAPTTPEQKRQNTIVAFTNHLKLLQYLPFKRNHNAHGIPLTLQQHHIEDVKSIISNHVFQGLCADALSLPLSQILVGCLDCLQEFVFADKIRKQTI